MSKPPSSSYGQILKSTAFTGGSTVITILLGIVRTKVMAVLLGPSGIGLIGVYMSITGIASTLAGMGISGSGVRQIAESAGSGDEERMARTVKTLRRTAMILGLAGALLLAAVSYPVSVLTFGDGKHAAAIAVLGLAVLFGSISSGQDALIQGLRRIADLARLNILGTLMGTFIGLPLVYFLRERAIVPMLVVLPGVALVFSWRVARRVPVAPVEITWQESAVEARALLSLGFAFMGSGLISAALTYLIRLLIIRRLGIDAAGYYGSAFMLGGLYAGFILQAMGTDFFPRLAAVADDHATANRLMNEQTEVGLLIAVPGILGTLSLAPWVIRLFYAGTFDPAIPVLQWQVLGIFMRMLCWPIGFILIAKGRGKLYLISETLANSIHAGLVWFLIPRFGLPGTGMAFAAMYVWATGVIFYLANQLTGFRWSTANLQMLAWMIPAVIGVFLVMQYLEHPWSLVVGLTTTGVASSVCLKGLLVRVPDHRLGRLKFLTRWAS